MVMYCDICGAKIENGDKVTECPECLCSFENVDKSSPIKEYKSKVPHGGIIKKISTDESFMNAMINLYETDPIEYQLKIQQFKAQLQQQKKQAEEKNINSSNQRKCRYCGSASFTPMRKKWSLLSGFMTNKVELICNKCGAKVQ